jgi:serine protease Do
MKKAFLAIIMLLPVFAFGQSLGRERVERLKQSVVNVYVDSEAVGTAFFITSDGWLLTCWQVASQALHGDETGLHIQKKITVEFADGERVAIGGFASVLLDKDLMNAVGYDYCLMKVEKMPSRPVTPLLVGRFENAHDGDEVYTCGYPLGSEQQFISKGIISTKFKEKYHTRLAYGDTTLIRDAAWLDITMNKGNTGGPVILMGRTPAEDVVIGVANAVQSPFVKAADGIYAINHSSQSSPLSGPPSGEGQLTSKALMNSSFGISGCISIDYFNAFVATYLKK